MVDQTFKIVGIDAAYSHSWEKLRRMMSITFCVRSELRAIEQETLNFSMVGNDVDEYTTHFYELTRLGSAMDEPESKKLEKYIGGLSNEIRMLVIAWEPDTMSEAIKMAIEAKELIVHTKTSGNNSDNKRKWNNNRGCNAAQQSPKGQEVNKAFAAEPYTKRRYVGKLPYCNLCNQHH